METTVLRQIDELNRMTMVQLRKRWADLLGTDPGRLGRNYLMRRLAYRIQELAYGGLDRKTRKVLEAYANGKTPKNGGRPRLAQRVPLTPGTRLLREWHGEPHEVVVEEKGFLYNGKRYKSLSATSRAITGSHWNGYRFFGLANHPGRKCV